MAVIVVKDSILEFNKKNWNACFVNILEDYDYLLTTEQAGIKGFQYYYITVQDDNKILAATSGFTTHYGLETTVQGVFKKILLAIKRVIPNFLTFSLSCLGSPETEINYLGFHPTINFEQKKVYLSMILEAFQKITKEKKINLLGIKDVPDMEKSLWDECLKGEFKAIKGLPTGIRAVKEKNLDEYLKILTPKTRKDMQRKLKAKENIVIKTYTNIDLISKELTQMYYETKNSSELQFGELTEKFFKDILKNLTNKSLCFAYYIKNYLIGFNLVLLNENVLIDKFFCMNKTEGRKYNLYFISWFHNVEYCIEKNIKTYQSGQSGYQVKLRLKSELLTNWIYFKHNIKLIDKLLKLFAPMFEFKLSTNV